MPLRYLIFAPTIPEAADDKKWIFDSCLARRKTFAEADKNLESRLMSAQAIDQWHKICKTKADSAKPTVRAEINERIE